MSKRSRIEFEGGIEKHKNYNFVWEYNGSRHFIWSYEGRELTQKRLPAILKRGIGRFLESQHKAAGRRGRRCVLRKSQDEYVIGIDTSRINIRTYCEELFEKQSCEISIPGRQPITFKFTLLTTP